MTRGGGPKPRGMDSSGAGSRPDTCEDHNLPQILPLNTSGAAADSDFQADRGSNPYNFASDIVAAESQESHSRMDSKNTTALNINDIERKRASTQQRASQLSHCDRFMKRSNQPV